MGSLQRDLRASPGSKVEYEYGSHSCLGEDPCIQPLQGPWLIVTT